jgi:hypothetical protein
MFLTELMIAQGEGRFLKLAYTSIQIDRKVRIRDQYFIKASHLRFVGVVLWQHCACASREAFISCMRGTVKQLNNKIFAISGVAWIFRGGGGIKKGVIGVAAPSSHTCNNNYPLEKTVS